MKRKGKPWRTSRDDFIMRVPGYGPVRVRGFTVFFPRAFGVARSRYFGIKRYGSEREALKCARAYRDAIVKTSIEPARRGGPSKLRRAAPFMIEPRKDNVSGVIGVGLAKGGKDWAAWYYPRPGRRKQRSFSISKFTNEGARMLAIMWRNQMIGKLRGNRSHSARALG